MPIEAPARALRLAALAALALCLCGAPARAEERKVALLIDDEALEKAADDALVDRKIVPVKELGTSRPPATTFIEDESKAAKLAKIIYELGGAELIVFGAVEVKDERKTEMGTSLRAEATLVVVSGRSGQRLAKVGRAEKGSAADAERARRKAVEAASKAAALALADDLVGILARPQELAIVVEVRGMTPDARDRTGEQVERALARAGLTLGARRLDIPTGVWRIETKTTAATQDDVERALRRAFREAGLGDWLALAEAPPGGFVYDWKDPVRSVHVVVHDMDDETQRVAGVELAAALAKLPGVASVDRAYDAQERAAVLTVKTGARLADLDAAIVAGRDGPLGALKLLRVAEPLERQEIHYRLVKAVAPYVVEIHAIESREVANVGVKIDDAVRSIQGYVSHERAQDPSQGLVKLTISFQGRPWELEKRLLEALAPVQELPQLIAVVPGKGGDLAYRAALSLNVAMRVRVEQVTPELYRGPGLKLMDLIAAIDGVRRIDRKYDPEHERIDLSVESAIDPIDLDMRLWRAIRGVPDLARLAPGESSGAALGYVFLSSAPEDWGGTIMVSALAPEAYAADGRLLVEAVRGLEGARKVEAVYDRDARELRIAVRYPRPAHELEEALWKALEGRTFSKAFSPDRRVGSVIRISFIERRGDRSRVFVRCHPLGDDASRAAARRLVERVKGLEGASEVTAEEQGDRLEIGLWSSRAPALVYDAVAGLLARDEALAPLVDGGLEGNVVVVRPGPGAGGARSTSSGLGLGLGAGVAAGSGAGGRLSDLVARLTPSVVLIQGRLPDGSSWIGTGFFVSSRGHILTNQHVAGAPSPQVPQEAVRLLVRTHDGRSFEAQYIDGNRSIDAALVKIAGEGYPAVEVADSDLLRQGDGLIIIGHPHGLEFSVTTGIVSALDRAKGRIQSTANTNPGNSGGPVFDEAGRVVAIHVAGSVDEVSLGGQSLVMKRPGINFHVPINQAVGLLQIAGAAPRAAGGR